MFIGEFASKEIRGILLTIHQVSLTFGVVFVYILGSLTNLFVIKLICGSITIIYVICFTFLPETPIFLIKNRNPEKAEKSIKFLRGENYNVKEETLYLQQLHEEELTAPKNSFLIEIRKRETYRAFVLVILLFFFFQMSGINAINFYTTTIFIEAGVKIDPSLATVIMVIVQALATLTSVGFVDRFGRVFLLKISFILMTVGLLGVGTFFYTETIKDMNFDYIKWLPLPSLCLVCLGFSAGLGPVPIILLGEIFSNEAKKVIAPFTQTWNMTLSFVIGIFYPALGSMIGTGLTFYLFAGFCIIGFLFTIFFVPETNGKSLEEIHKILSN